jgi:hypothetical protein
MKLAFSLLFILKAALAFLPPTLRASTFVKSPLKVVIFDPDPNTRGPSWIDDDYDGSPLSDRQLHIAEELSRRMSSLARLACAFSPPGHSLALNDIESVSVIEIDESHIDLAAVICEDGGCVTVKVPVIFPLPCDNSDDEECILDQFDKLDHAADHVLENLKTGEESRQEREVQWKELISKEGLSYPSWWENEASIELGRECQSIKDLLNQEDFQPEIQCLALSGLLSGHQIPPETFVLEKAGVAAVCVNGLCVKARIARHSISAEATKEIVQIPLQFGTVATNVADLRAAVLGLVASTC